MVTISPLHVISIICIIVMVVTLLLGYLKKIMMTYVIIITNFIVLGISVLSSVFFSNQVIQDLAFQPAFLSPEKFPQLYTAITSMFLHSVTDPFHIIFNTLMFILVAPHFENRIGRNKFLAIYLLTGVCGAFFHSLVAPLFSSPFDYSTGLIGASGAISGIIGAYAFAYPRDTVYFPLGFFIMKIPILMAGAFFIAIQSIYIFIGGDSNVAYLAHIGGFIAGVVLAAAIFRKREKEDTSPYGTHATSQKIPAEKKLINFSTLSSLATTKELKDVVKRIQNETVLQVHDIWLEHFLEKITCPVCHKPLNHFERKIWCEENHFRTEF